ncbi:hypothetical protein [Micromonospora sp.]|uniref:hypothetical protein n=1 Tax=Micromonospora sp. TaxID=1876 RepID=UPI003B3B4B63
MRPSGLVLVIGGVWVLCQVLAGRALQRLGLTDATGPDPFAPPGVARPDDGYGPGFRDGQGRPL